MSCPKQLPEPPQPQQPPHRRLGPKKLHFSGDFSTHLCLRIETLAGGLVDDGERLSVAMALAEKLHHSANRTALPKEEEVEQDYAPRGQKPARAGPGTQFLFVGGVSVPEPVGEPQLQARVQRHTMEQRIEHTPYVQILDAPVPQVADFVLDVFRALDNSIAEQVIEVPKFSCSSCPSRSPCLEPQMAEQLVDVPTIISFFSLQRNVEQIVDIPVPLGRGRRLQDSLPRQGSTASGAEQIADSPFGGGLHGFLPGLVPQRPASSSLLTVPLEVFKVFLPDMSPDSVLRSRTSTFQLPVSVPVAHGVLRSRTSTFLFVAHALMVVFKVFLQDRVPHSVR